MVNESTNSTVWCTELLFRTRYRTDHIAYQHTERDPQWINATVYIATLSHTPL
jgi:hypothetical protein